MLSIKDEAPLLLVTIPQSHFCEKARWALDYTGATYKEEAHMPMFHLPAVKLRGGRGSTPILKTPRGLFDDSTDILHYLDAFLPDEKRFFPWEENLCREVSRLEDRFDRVLGPAGRLWVYWHLLPNKELAISIIESSVPRYQAILGEALFGAVRGLMSRKMSITEQRAEESLRDVRTIFAEVSALLSDGRPFLVGGRFTAADLCFASLGAIVVLPAEYGGPLPTIEQTPPKMREVIEELRATPAGKFLTKLYQEHRKP